MKRNQSQYAWVYWTAGTVPVIWLALLTAPCLGGNIIEIFTRVTQALQTPMRISWCSDSIKTILVFLVAYGIGIAILGFVKYHGMTAEQFIKAYIESEFLMPKQLGSHPTNLYAELMQDSPFKEVLKVD